MNALRDTILAIVIIGVLAGALFLMQGRRNPLCEPALILGGSNYHPQNIIAALIDDLGGLPQKDADLGAADNRRAIVSVTDWEIRSAVVQNSNNAFIGALRAAKPIMTYAIDLDVAWEDGASGVVQWTSWRYGLVSCPLALAKGGGPTGKIRLIVLTPSPAKTPTPQG